jgi:hypothetical protein
MKPESENPTTSNCSKCQAETSLEDLFCQECGQNLERGQNLEPGQSMESVRHPEPGQNLDGEDAAGDPQAPALWEASPAREHGRSELFGYYSTLEPERQPKKSWFSIDLSPNAAKPVIQLPVIIFVLALLAVSPFAIMALANSYDSMGEQYICDHARQALAKGNVLEAVEDMQRLYLDRSGKLHKETLSLFAQALIARSDSYLQKKSLPSAMKDLRDVPPDLPESAIAAAKLKALEDVINAPSNLKVGTAVALKGVLPTRSRMPGSSDVSKSNSVKQKTHPAAPAIEPAIAAKLPLLVPPPPPLAPEEAAVSVTKTSALVDERTRAANSALLAESLSHAKVETNHSKDGPNLGKTKGKVTPVQQYEANDVAKYNELLAGYFSQERQIHNGSGVAQEPLSFKEWIGSGKPDFR